MSFNEEELIKIKKATSGFFKKSARATIVDSLSSINKKIILAKNMDESDKKAALLKLMNEATEKRQRVLQSGANSYGHPEWAAAAACESWLQELFGGTPESIERVEVLIKELSCR